MSILADGLALHLRLDEADGTLAADQSKAGADGKVVGDLRRVWDGDFGTVPDFAGSKAYVAAPDPLSKAGGWTLALWVRRGPEAPAQGTEGIAGLDSDEAGGHGGPALWWSGGALRYVAGAGAEGSVAAYFPPGSEWLHLGWISDGRAERFYRNGTLVAEEPALPRAGKDGLQLRVGRLGGEQWSGRIANLRVWRRALAEPELWEALAADRVIPFRASHPIGFELRGPDDEHAIYIVEGARAAELSLRLSVRNDSGRPIVFRALPPGEAAEGAHHLRLRFRRGALSRASLAGLALVGRDGGWVASRPVEEADSVSVFLRRAGSAPWSLAAGVAAEVTLGPVSADAGAGTRTTRVELLTRALGFDEAGHRDEAIEEVRSQSLSIVNHSGRQHAPLHVGLTGSDTVLNDGRASAGNDLRLLVTNTLAADAARPERSDLVLAGADGPVPTRFVFTVAQEPNDASGTMPWALGRAGELQDMAVIAPEGWSVKDEALGETRRWTLTPARETVLGPGRSVAVRITGIVSSLPSGPADLVVRWEDLPGYWDDQRTLTVEKSPLVLRQGSVGVGTSEPRGFHVLVPENGTGGPGVLLSGGAQGNAKMELRNAAGGTPYIDFSVTGSDYDARLILTAPKKLSVAGASLGIGVDDPRSLLDVNGNIMQRGFDLILGYGNNDRGDTGHSRALVKESGPRLTVNYASDFTGGVNVRGPSIMLDGKVGVGVDAGAAQLTVRAAGTHLQLRREASEAARGKVLFLELYQDQAGTDNVFPSIRFHHNNRFWHRLEGRSEGMYVMTGDLNSDARSNLYGATGNFSALQIGSVSIGERELQILQRLAAGSLEFDLYNVKQDEYLYAGDYAPYDNDRRRVFTWRPKNRVGQGRWRLTYPG